MSVCKPIIPSGVLKYNNRPVAASIDNLLDQFTNPLLRYDQAQIRLLTVLTNSLLQSSQDTVLNDYPNLKVRFDQGSITEEEFADFLSNRGLTPTYIQTVYTEDYPYDINIDAINEAINRVTDALNETLQQFLNDNLTSTLPIPPISELPEDQSELDQFNPSVPVSELLEWTPTSNMDNVLSEMDTYYSDNYGAILNKSDACAALTNPFTKLSSLIASASALATAAAGLIDFAKDLSNKVSGLINSIRNFSLSSLINGLVSKLANLKNEILSIIDRSFSDAVSRLNNLKNTAIQLIKDIPGLPRAAFRMISKKLRQIENFITNFNIDRIKAKVKSILTINEDQFEDLLPAVINLLSLKACAIGNFIDAILRKPFDEFTDFVNLMQVNFNIMENISIDRLNRVLDAGGLRLGREERETLRRTQAETANRISQPRVETTVLDPLPGQPQSGLEPRRHIILNITDEEADFVAGLTATYSDLFRFSPAVRNMGVRAREVYNNGGNGVLNHWQEWDEGENGPDAGWKMIAERHPYVYVALARAARRLRNDGLLSGPLIITSAFRSRYYNRVVLAGQGAARNSMHMHAMALDIDDDASGLTSAGSARLIDYLSEEGFTRFGIYSGFIHADIAAGVGSVIFRNDRSSDRNILAAVNNHRSRAS